MKKSAAILFFLLLLFNLFGYKLIFYYAQQQSDVQLLAALDNDLYDSADLVTVKVKLSLPYQVNSTYFERTDGEIRVHGKIYRYVKRKYFDGELTLLCLPDVNKMRIETAKDDFFKNVNGLITNNGSSNTEKTKADFLKNFSGEYIAALANESTAAYVSIIRYGNDNLLSAIQDLPEMTLEKPPQPLTLTSPV